MRRAAAALAVAAAAVFALAGLAGPARAIETAAFGLTPAGSQARTALHEDVRPGHSKADAVRLFNKTDAPLTLALSVQGASLDAAGHVQLGGTGGAAGWVRLAKSTVTLAPKASAVIGVVVDAPRTMPAHESTAAVVAEPVPAGSSDVAVVQRVALMVYVRTPPGSPLKAALGWAAWVAVLLLAGVVVFAVSGRGLRRRRPAPPALDEPRG